MFDQDKYLKALHFAATAHGEEKTDYGLPYVTHITAVAMEVVYAISKEEKLEENKANTAVVTALLHSVIENTQYTYDDIFDAFGLDIAEAVDALSKDTNLCAKEQMSDSLNKLLAQPYEIQMIKLADKIINLQQPPTHWDSQKIYANLQDAKLILSCLKNSNIHLSKRLEDKINGYRVYIK